VAAFNRDAVLTLRGRLAWAHDWVSNPALAAAFQALPGTNFIVNGATPAKDSALVSTGAELQYPRRRPIALFPWHRRPGSHVPYESLIELRAASMPDAAWAVSGHPPS
jgi:hypothetical protein